MAWTIRTICAGCHPSIHVTGTPGAGTDHRLFAYKCRHAREAAARVSMSHPESKRVHALDENKRYRIACRTKWKAYSPLFVTPDALLICLTRATAYETDFKIILISWNMYYAFILSTPLCAVNEFGCGPRAFCLTKTKQQVIDRHDGRSRRHSAFASSACAFFLLRRCLFFGNRVPATLAIRQMFNA